MRKHSLVAFALGAKLQDSITPVGKLGASYSTSFLTFLLFPLSGTPVWADPSIISRARLVHFSLDN
jgi:hypothetical protein